MKFNRKVFMISIIGVFLGMAWTFPANAVPSFADQYDKKCSYCHTAWPQLNSKGRQFKEQGYRLSSAGEVKLDDYLQDWDNFPISAHIISRPYDKKERAAKNIRALHEIELMVAGALNKFSVFFEIESEDEASNDFGFDIGIPNAVLSYHHNDMLNLQFLWGDAIFWADPYGFYGSRFRLTPERVGIVNQDFEGADKLSDGRQMIGLYGRIMDRLFYNVGWSGDTSGGTVTTEGKDANNYHGRLAFDITDDIMIGGFFMDGRLASSNNPGIDYQRWGIDGQVDFKNLRLQAAYLSTEGETGTPGVCCTDDDNSVFSIQAFYTFKKKSGRPTFVPMIRYDSYEKSDGTDDRDVMFYTLNYYITQNVKANVEYLDEMDEFTGVKTQDRIRLQLQVAF